MSAKKNETIIGSAEVIGDDTRPQSDVAPAQQSLFSDAQLSEVTDVKSAAALLAQIGADFEDFDDYGSGFVMLDEAGKGTLVGAELALLQWSIKPGDFGKDYAVVVAVAKDGRKVMFSDGGAGIPKQLADVSDRRIERGSATPYHGLKLARGLRRSDYEYTDEKGNTSAATTFYLG